MTTDGAPYAMTLADGTAGLNWRAPFEAGNRASVRHGAGSQALVAERAAVILDELRESMPWLEECDAVAVEGLCRALGTFRPLDDYIAAVMSGATEAYPRSGAPRTGVEAVPERVWRAWRGAGKLVEEFAGRLGMTPTDRAGLMRDTGWARHLARQEAVSRLAERGQAIREGKPR